MAIKSRRSALKTFAALGAAAAAGSQKAFSATPVRFYVSLKGDDSWSGRRPSFDKASKDGPFRTLARARAAVRALRKNGELGQPVTITVRGGTYYLDETLILTPEDSGTASCPIVWEAASGEEVVLSGGKPLQTAWQNEKSTPLRKEDRAIWYTDLPEARGGAWRFRQLFVNERREPRARFPNAAPDDLMGGWLYARGYEGFGGLLSGMAKPGDFAQYRFTARKAGAYTLWLGYASASNATGRLVLTIDGKNIPLAALPASGGFRTVRWTRAAVSVPLGAGEHQLRYELGPGPDSVLHWDAFVLTDNAEATATSIEGGTLRPDETRVVVQAESAEARVAGKASHTIGFQTIYASPANDTVLCAPGVVHPAWRNAPDAQVHLFAGPGWFNEIARLAASDPDTGTLHLTGRELQSAIYAGNRFFVEGVREELDAPGEWHLDTSAGRLFYWPRNGSTPEQASIIAPRLQTVLHLRADVGSMERVRHLSFRGFTFAHADYTPDHVSVRTAQDATVLWENAQDCALQNCRFRAGGGSAPPGLSPLPDRGVRYHGHGRVRDSSHGGPC